MQEYSYCCLANVRQNGEIRFCSAVVVDESFVRLEVEAEELILEGPERATIVKLIADVQIDIISLPVKEPPSQDACPRQTL